MKNFIKQIFKHYKIAFLSILLLVLVFFTMKVLYSYDVKYFNGKELSVIFNILIFNIILSTFMATISFLGQYIFTRFKIYELADSPYELLIFGLIGGTWFIASQTTEIIRNSEILFNIIIALSPLLAFMLIIKQSHTIDKLSKLHAHAKK
ncbi:hypothetical protein NQ656_17320 [Acinetobacter baumannii]|nr:hypothetical protein [Acinetobacter baumannii]